MAAKKRQRAKKRAGAAAAPPPLTPREQTYLEAFGDLVDELKRSPQQRKDSPEERKNNPSVRDVGEHVGKSENVAQQPLKNLADKGYLEDEWGWKVIGRKLTPNGEDWLAYRRGTRKR